MFTTSTTFYLLYGIVIFSLAHYLKTRNAKLPPGPRGVPFLGNIFQLELKTWHVFEKWKGIYGPIMYIHVLGQPIVILNTREAATELLHRRAANYSDRPRNIVAGHYTSHGLTIALTRYGELWRRLRRASHSALKLSSSTQYCLAQADEARLLAYDMLNNSESWDKNIYVSTASAVTTMIYNRPRAKSGNDPAIQQLIKMAHQFEKDMHPGTHLVEFLPILDYLPSFLAKWRTEAESNYVSFSAIFREYLSDVKERMAKSQQGPCICASLVEQSNDLSDQEIAWTCGVLYIAGFDTTNCTLLWFIYSMILFPEAQQAAQAELDRVVGRSRTPTFADMEQLPYVHALVKEVLRWRPAVPLGIPHVAVEDDWYEGYFIPKGSLCVSNIWSINHDQETYGPDALLFKPERHLNKDGSLKKDAEGHVSYGFGRRICVGRHVANNAVFISIATLLWATTIERARDADGNVLMPDRIGEESEGALCRPPPGTKCNVVPRFPDVKMILQQEREMIMSK